MAIVTKGIWIKSITTPVATNVEPLFTYTQEQIIINYNEGITQDNITLGFTQDANRQATEFYFDLQTNLSITPTLNVKFEINPTGDQFVYDRTNNILTFTSATTTTGTLLQADVTRLHTDFQTNYNAISQSNFREIFNDGTITLSIRRASTFSFSSSGTNRIVPRFINNNSLAKYNILTDPPLPTLVENNGASVTSNNRSGNVFVRNNIVTGTSANFEGGGFDPLTGILTPVGTEWSLILPRDMYDVNGNITNLDEVWESYVTFDDELSYASFTWADPYRAYETFTDQFRDQLRNDAEPGVKDVRVETGTTPTGDNIVSLFFDKTNNISDRVDFTIPRAVPGIQDLTFGITPEKPLDVNFVDTPLDLTVTNEIQNVEFKADPTVVQFSASDRTNIDLTTDETEIALRVEQVNVSFDTLGAQGPRGFQGISVLRVFTRNDNTPTQANETDYNLETRTFITPDGWSQVPPTGIAQLWISEGTFDPSFNQTGVVSSNLVGIKWSNPFQAGAKGVDGTPGRGITNATASVKSQDALETTYTVTLSYTDGTTSSYDLTLKNGISITSVTERQFTDSDNKNFVELTFNKTDGNNDAVTFELPIPEVDETADSILRVAPPLTIGSKPGTIWTKKFTYSTNVRVGSDNTTVNWIETIPGLQDVELNANGTTNERSNYLILDANKLTNRQDIDFIDTKIGRQ